MPICSYVVLTEEGRRDEVVRALSGLPGCDVVPAENAEIVLLVTEAPDLSAEAGLRTRAEAVPGVRSLTLTFGDIDPDTPEADPLGGRRGRRRPEPVDPAHRASP